MPTIALIAICLAGVAAGAAGALALAHASKRGQDPRGQADAAVEQSADAAEELALAQAALQESAALEQDAEQKAETDAEREAEQAPEPAAEPAQTQSRLDMAELSLSLFRSQDPVGSLEQLVADVRRRERGGADVKKPSVLELFLARSLEEAGIGVSGLDMPRISVVRPETSGLFYLRVDDPSMSYLSKLRILKIEAALNAAVFIDEWFGEKGPASLVEAFRLQQRIRSSITAQDVPMPEPEDGWRDGEWELRRRFSNAVECLRLPYRLSCNYRSCASAGNIAIEVALTPPDVFPTTQAVDELGLVPTTADMRTRAASDYALRLVVLMARTAFAASPSLERAWIAGTISTGASHSCHISGCFARDALEALDPAHEADPRVVLDACGISYRFEGSALAPVAQGFSLEDEAFCPQVRFEAPEESARMLDGAWAQALGAKYAHELSIDESRTRIALANDMMRELDGSCEHNVGVLMQFARKSGDAGMLEAAKRTAAKLIDGSLSDDAWEIASEFVDGGSLKPAVKRAQELIQDKRIEEARALLANSVDALDATGAYLDGAGVEWRFFSNYIDRVIYNRMLAPKGVATRLVDKSYLEAQVLLSAANLMLGRISDALAFAYRAEAIAPLSAPVRFHLVQCLEMSGNLAEAREQLERILRYAHAPEVLAAAYYRLASFLWQSGELRAAQASYQRAISLIPSQGSLAAAELHALMLVAGGMELETMDDDEINSVLEGAGVPLAPSGVMMHLLYEGARASVDAELFPVAREFMGALAAIARDDVLFGMLRSIEGEPDR